MAKIKKKLSASTKAAKREAKLELQKKYETIFMNGKQVRVKRQQLHDGIPVDEFICQNADAIWLHQNGMWEHIDDYPVDSTIKPIDISFHDQTGLCQKPSEMVRWLT